MNKLNQSVAQAVSRDADEMLRKPFIEWCALAQMAHELKPKVKPTQPKPIKRR